MIASLETSAPRPLRTLIETGVFLAACAVATGAIIGAVLAAAPSLPLGAVVLHACAIALPVMLAVAMVLRRRETRLAVILVGAALLSAVVALAESTESIPYSAGRVAVWLMEPVLVYLILAFPYGRLPGRPERRLFTAAVLDVGLLYLPTALFAEYPTPTPWSRCGTSCPSNAFSLTGSDPAVIDHFIRPLREVITVLIFAGVVALVARRIHRGAALTRMALAPVIVIAVARWLAMVVYFPARAGGGSEFADVLGWMYAYSLPAIALALTAGLVGQRLFAAEALQKLPMMLAPEAGPGELRAAMSEALRDPSLRIVFRVPGESARWVDETGWPVRPPQAQTGQMVTEVRSEGRLLAAIIHDSSLAMAPGLVPASASYALTMLENERLVGELQASLRDLSDSRVRLVTVADRERRKIERDLHDGAQQRLVALRIKLELMAEQVEDSSPESAQAIRALEEDVEETIDEVRAFARGVYPSLLAERGLTEALRAAGRSAPLPTMVDAAAIRRYPPEIESTIYFACMEALQNAAKHARDATSAVIRVRENGRLEFEVRDDGSGFNVAETGYGSGLAGLRDRLAAVGGYLTVESAPGLGTKVTGAIPVG